MRHPARQTFGRRSDQYNVSVTSLKQSEHGDAQCDEIRQELMYVVLPARPYVATVIGGPDAFDAKCEVERRIANQAQC